MDKLTKQFFGDAKRMQLSSKEKAQLWQGISTFAAAKQIAMSSTEKAASFDAIAAHMKQNPMSQPASSSLFTWFAFHKMVASVMVAVLIISVGGGSVAYAAQAAVPGDALYDFKVEVTEPLIDAALAFDPEKQAEWERRRLKRRVKEAEHLSANASLTSDHRAHLQERIEKRMEMIQARLDAVPEQERDLFKHRVDDIMDRHQKFLDAVEEGTVTKEEVRAFKEHVHSVRNRAHQKWGGKPPRPGPGGRPPKFDRDTVPQEVIERREERGLPVPGERRQIPQEIKERREELGLPIDRKPSQKEGNFGPSGVRKSPPDRLQKGLDGDVLPPKRWLKGQNPPRQNGQEPKGSRGLQSPPPRHGFGSPKTKSQHLPRR